MASDIQVSSLTATAGVGQIGITAIALPPAGMECLSYMQPAKVEIWASATNNRAGATKVGETSSGFYIHGGLAASTTRYYWARAVDGDGNLGAFFPASETAGVSATALTTIPPNGSVTTPKLANGAVTTAKIGDAQITNAKIQSLSADKLTAGTVTATISFTSPIINGGEITGSVFQTRATGARLWIDRNNNALAIFNSSNQIRAGIGGSGNASGQFTNYANFEAVTVTATLTSANAHAIRAKNSGSGGGEAVLGVSAGGGGYGLNASTGGCYSPGGYLPFTGMHECLARKDADLDLGDIVYVKRVLHSDDLNNVLTDVDRTDSVADRRVIGVISALKDIPAGTPLAAMGQDQTDETTKRRRSYLRRNYQLVTVNALGEGQMLVCGRGGDIGAGDYIITSDLPGKGQRLDMDQPVTFGLQAAIVAQAMEAVTFDSPDQVRRVAVFYRCG